MSISGDSRNNRVGQLYGAVQCAGIVVTPRLLVGIAIQQTTLEMENESENAIYTSACTASP